MGCSESHKNQDLADLVCELVYRGEEKGEKREEKGRRQGGRREQRGRKGESKGGSDQRGNEIWVWRGCVSTQEIRQ